EQDVVLTQRRVGVEEVHTLLLEVLPNAVVNNFTFILRGHSGDQSLLLRLGDAELVVSVLDVGRQVVPRRRLLFRRPHEVLDVVEVDPREVRSPVGHGLLVEQAQAFEPEVEHPLRLVLEPGDLAHLRLGQPTRRCGTRLVGVGPAELVTTETFEVWTVGGRHDLSVLPGVDADTGVSGMCVVQTPSPCAIVASRCTCRPTKRPIASVSASHSAGNSSATCCTGQWCWQTCTPQPPSCTVAA